MNYKYKKYFIFIMCKARDINSIIILRINDNYYDNHIIYRFNNSIEDENYIYYEKNNILTFQENSCYILGSIVSFLITIYLSYKIYNN